LNQSSGKLVIQAFAFFRNAATCAAYASVPDWLAKYEKAKESKQWKTANAVMK
jgi:hypothetical protein